MKSFSFINLFILLISAPPLLLSDVAAAPGGRPAPPPDRVPARVRPTARLPPGPALRLPVVDLRGAVVVVVGVARQVGRAPHAPPPHRLAHHEQDGQDAARLLQRGEVI